MNEQNAVLSNKFTVSILEDGSQFTGALVSDNALTQAWNGSAAVPDWSVIPAQGETDIRPLVYMILNYGGTAVGLVPSTTVLTAANSGTWTYNNTVLTFDFSNPKNPGQTPLRYPCTNYVVNGIDYRNIFELTSKNIGTVGNPIYVPALKVIGNLAGLDVDGTGPGNILNADSDIIGFTTEVTYEGNRSFTISDEIIVTITKISSDSNFGVLSATKSALLSQDETSTVTATLYNSYGTAVSGTWYSKFYLNGTLINQSNTTHYVTIAGSDFEDYAVVKCEFRMTENGDPVWTAVIGIDDLEDDNVMMLTSATANVTSIPDFPANPTYGPGSDAAISSAQSIKFRLYVVKKDDITTPVTSTTFPYFYVQLLNYKGEVFDGTGPEGDISGYPVITTTSQYPSALRAMTASGEYRDMILIGQEIKSKLKGSLTGIVYSYEQSIQTV